MIVWFYSFPVELIGNCEECVEPDDCVQERRFEGGEVLSKLS